MYICIYIYIYIRFLCFPAIHPMPQAVGHHRGARGDGLGRSGGARIHKSLVCETIHNAYFTCLLTRIDTYRCTYLI